MVVLVMIAAALIGMNIYKDHLLGKIHYVPVIQNPTMINEEGSVVSLSEVVATETTVIPIPEFPEVHNILLVGIDSRAKSYSEDGSGSRADVILIMTVNEDEKSIKFTSVARDILAYIPGYTEPQKINSAMTYGGPELLMIVLENSLRIELDEYVYVNFYHMEKIINAVGGAYVYVSETERTYEPGGLNQLIKEQNVRFGADPETYLVEFSGTQRLNGRQAVAYSRIRKVGNGDYGRSKRQIEVLSSMMNQFLNLSITGKANAADTIACQLYTNISQEKIEWYVFTFLSDYYFDEFEYLRLPIEGYSNEGLYSDLRVGEWSIRPDWNGMIPLVQDFIFGERFHVDEAKTIPGAPNS